MRGGITCNFVLEHRVRYHQAAAFNNLALGALNGLRLPRALQTLVYWNCYAVNREFELFTQLGFSHWPRPLEDRHDRKRRRIESKNDRTDATQGKLRKYGFEILTRCTAIGDLAQGRVRSLPYQPSWSALKLRKQVTDPVWTGGRNGTCGHVSYNQTPRSVAERYTGNHPSWVKVCAGPLLSHESREGVARLPKTRPRNAGYVQEGTRAVVQTARQSTCFHTRD
jgi:hypothetical protein